MTTSARLVCRAKGGFGDYLKSLLTSLFLDHHQPGSGTGKIEKTVHAAVKLEPNARDVSPLPQAVSLNLDIVEKIIVSLARDAGPDVHRRKVLTLNTHEE